MFKQLHGEKHEIDHTLSIFANASNIFQYSILLYLLHAQKSSGSTLRFISDHEIRFMNPKGGKKAFGKSTLSFLTFDV